MTALLIVRAEVPDPATRPAFDAWYRDEHLPDALSAFGCRRAWRGWSPLEAEVHMAFYEFDTLEQALALPGSDALAGMVAEFDRLWAGKVTRTREIVPVEQALPA